MYGFIQVMLGFAIMLSIIAIIMPSLFHMIYGKLNRKHAFAIFLGIMSIMWFTPVTEKVSVGVEREDAAINAEVTRAREERAAKREFLSKIKLTHTLTQNVIGTPELHITVKNGTEKTIDGLELSTSFQNNFGEPVGKWGVAKEDVFIGRSQDIIKPGATAKLEWNLAVYEAATKAKPPVIDRVHFTDGTSVEMPPEE